MPRPQKDNTYQVLGLTLAFSLCLLAALVHVIMISVESQGNDPTDICMSQPTVRLNWCLWAVAHEHIGKHVALKDLTPVIDRYFRGNNG